ncbi:MAG: helix-turn-helix domain-containing protein [Gammaproteobacteria bacterium]
MARKNVLTSSPPYAGEQALKRLGANLRTARLRRNLTIDDVAEKIGTGRYSIMAAEKGKPSTSAAVFTALLWTYDLLGPMELLADPATDQEGIRLSSRRERARAGKLEALNDEF